MHLEDEIVEEFRVRERNEEKLHEALEEKDKAISTQERLIAEQAKRIAELERLAGQKT